MVELPKGPGLHASTGLHASPGLHAAKFNTVPIIIRDVSMPNAMENKETYGSIRQLIVASSL